MRQTKGSKPAYLPGGWERPVVSREELGRDFGSRENGPQRPSGSPEGSRDDA
jgi:hypothetical protein